jgi:hypothetical protein
MGWGLLGVDVGLLDDVAPFGRFILHELCERLRRVTGGFKALPG